MRIVYSWLKRIPDAPSPGSLKKCWQAGHQTSIDELPAPSSRLYVYENVLSAEQIPGHRSLAQVDLDIGREVQVVSGTQCQERVWVWRWHSRNGDCLTGSS